MGVLKVQWMQRNASANNKVRLAWSEPANAADAATSGNYSADNSMTISAAVVVAGTNNMQVDLTVNAIARNVQYHITVINVRDIAGGTPITGNQAVGTFKDGVGDNNLDGIPIHGGQLIRV